jgi:hypothetical protein
MVRECMQQHHLGTKASHYTAGSDIASDAYCYDAISSGNPRGPKSCNRMSNDVTSTSYKLLHHARMRGAIFDPYVY